MELPPPPAFLAFIFILFFGIGLHEYAHCKFADLAGDPTPRFFGRVTLNLFKHFDPIGTLMMFLTMISGVGIGWGKPAPINPEKMRNPRWDTFIAVIAGPISNIAQAVVYAIFLRLAINTSVLTSVDLELVFAMSQSGPFLGYLCVFGILTNLSLAAFNLIPFGVLDGHWLVGLLMPEKPRHYWFKFSRTTGWYILIGVILIGQLSGFSIIGRLIGPPVMAGFRALSGL